MSSAQLSEQVMTALKADDPTVTQQRVEFVGPQVGKELYENGALALLLVCIGIVAYLALRFEWRFAVSAIIANLHDVVIILGFFALFQWEFSLPVLAAVLAVLGYSVNESVVIADRIRENFRKMRKASVPHVIDNAITSTLSRTIITHGCTLMMVLSILFFGGETLHYFALALTIGICFGIYSSALVMASLVMWLGVSREDLVKPEQEKRRGGCREDPALTGRRSPPGRRDADHAALLAARARPDARGARRGQHPGCCTRCCSLIIFAETGLVVFPFLPGDSLLFIAGTVAAASGINVHLLVVALLRRGGPRRLGQLRRSAAYIGPKVFDRRTTPTLALAQAGAPRAHAPLLRQVRRLHDHHRPLRSDRAHLRAVSGRRRRDDATADSCAFNVIGAVAWVASLVYAGYLFGNIPWVKDNLSVIVIGDRRRFADSGRRAMPARAPRAEAASARRLATAP